MSGRTTTTTLIPLTCAQIHLVRALWRQVYTTKGPTVIGASIYHRLCFKNVMVCFMYRIYLLKVARFLKIIFMNSK